MLIPAITRRTENLLIGAESTPKSRFPSLIVFCLLLWPASCPWSFPSSSYLSIYQAFRPSVLPCPTMGDLCPLDFCPSAQVNPTCRLWHTIYISMTCQTAQLATDCWPLALISGLLLELALPKSFQPTPNLCFPY